MGLFVWARRALNRRKRRLPARAVSPTNALRIGMHAFFRHPRVEMFLLLLILLNLLALAATSPGSDLVIPGQMADASTFDQTMEVFNVFCAVCFTIEAGVRIVVHGFIRGEGAYMRRCVVIQLNL
jgi:hypothetical protein